MRMRAEGIGYHPRVQTKRTPESADESATRMPDHPPSNPLTGHPRPSPKPAGPFPDARRFQAEADVAELDQKGRPVGTWPVVTEHLSGSGLSFLSRRLVYPGVQLVIAVHLLDATPTLLAGRVRVCDYVGESDHRVIIDLEVAPSDEAVTRWLLGRAPRRRGA